MLGAWIQSLVRELDPTSHNQVHMLQLTPQLKILYATTKFKDPECCN